MVYQERDPRVLGVLERALHSTSRMTRLRAVSMLARVDCEARITWLEEASSDSDDAVNETARCVLAWVVDPVEPLWPQREDTGFDRVSETCVEEDARVAQANGSRWKWEYVVEIWRDDGLLLGTYLAATCKEDDEHARRIALGQAILANSGGRGDAFDASTAAAFIVSKKRLSGCADMPGRRKSDAGKGGAG